MSGHHPGFLMDCEVFPENKFPERSWILLGKFGRCGQLAEMTAPVSLTSHTTILDSTLPHLRWAQAGPGCVNYRVDRVRGVTPVCAVIS